MQRNILLICLLVFLLPSCAAPKTIVIVVTATAEAAATPTLSLTTSTPIPPAPPSPTIPLPTVAQLSATAVPLIPNTPTPTPAYILWDEAGAHVGETTTVCGPVMDSHFAETSNGKPTFLNIGAKYPDPERFTVVIWDSDRDKFPSDPAQLYLDQNICVTGKIEDYNGSIEIVVEDPAQIEIQTN